MNTPTIDDGGPAFPCNWYDYQPTTGEQVVRESYPGLSLRDYIAAKALTGLIINKFGRDFGIQEVADEAYDYADAMLVARKPMP